jgi:hypothetical protein
MTTWSQPLNEHLAKLEKAGRAYRTLQRVHRVTRLLVLVIAVIPLFLMRRLLHGDAGWLVVRSLMVMAAMLILFTAGTLLLGWLVAKVRQSNGLRRSGSGVQASVLGGGLVAGLAAWRLGDDAAAIQALEKSLRSWGSHPGAAPDLGQTLCELLIIHGRPAEACRILEGALEKKGSVPLAATLALAHVVEDPRNTTIVAEAAALAEAAATTDALPRHRLLAKVMLCQLRLLSLDTAGAVASADDIVRLLVATSRWTRWLRIRLVWNRTRVAQAYVVCATAYEARGMGDQARAALQIARQTDPQSRFGRHAQAVMDKAATTHLLGYPELDELFVDSSVRDIDRVARGVRGRLGWQLAFVALFLVLETSDHWLKPAIREWRAGPCTPRPLAQSVELERIAPDNASRMEEIGALCEAGLRDEIKILTFLDEGRIAAGAAEHPILLWDVSRATAQRLGEEGVHWWDAATTPDHRTLVASSSDRMVAWDVASGRPVFDRREAAARRATHVSFTPQSHVVAVYQDGVVREWRSDGTFAEKTVAPSEGSNLRLGRQHDVLAVVSGKKLFLGKPGALGEPVRLQEGMPWAMEFSPDDRLLAVSIGSGSWFWRLAFGWGKPELRVYETAQRTLLHALSNSRALQALAWSPDGRVVVAGSGDGALTLWDPTVGRLLARRDEHGGGIGVVALSGSGRLVASGGEGGMVRLWGVRALQTAVNSR